MAGEIQLISTTMATESSGTITLSNVDSATNRTNLGLGSMATQAANSVSISGGTIGSDVVFPSEKLVKSSLISFDNSGTQIGKSGTLSEISTSLRLTHQALSTSNKLLFEFQTPIVSPNSNNLMWAYFYNVTGTSIVNAPTSSGSRKTIHFAQRVSAYDDNDMHNFSMRVVANPPNTSSNVYTVYFGTEGSIVEFFQSTLSSISGFSAQATFSILEFQA